MNPIAICCVVAGAFLVSLLVTRWIERRAAALGLVQAPNERSSHVVPTPRGGGVGMAVAGVLAGLYFTLAGTGQFGILIALAGVIAILGYIDDLHDLAPGIRFGVQGVAISLLVLTIPAMPGLALPMAMVLGGWVLALVVIVIGLWWINLFNFMDGIDGLAASQAIVILLGAASIWLLREGAAPQAALFWLAVAIAAAAGGFLLRNWPPARIFMGDAGSNFLAFMILGIALMTIAAGALGYASWLILVSVFLTDATVTLVRRTARGEKPWKAHRRHAYQQLSRRWGHRAVTSIYGGVSLCWALPLAWGAAAFPEAAWILALVAVVPLAGLAVWGGAGQSSERS